ncbi:5016_t:CDS:2, partial [Cetraspora pellucida]
MLPPPPKIYKSANELLQNVQAFANSQGGVYRSFRTQQRQTSTRLINCPCELKAVRLDEQLLANITEITSSGSCPRKIISIIRQNNSSAFVRSKDIYNARKRLRQQKLAGHTPVEALINKFKEGDYMYEYKITDRELALMNALRTTFSNSTNLLCLWHINKNIMKNCKSQFEDNEWQTFLLEWNKVEGVHATIKTYLCILAGDLRDVCIKISLAVKNQKKEIDTMAASEKICFPIFAQNNSLYENIKGKVSTFALKKMEEQYQKIIQESLPLCTGSFSSTMGLPYAHKIQLLENHQGLTLDDFHKHWWIQNCSLILPIKGNNELQPFLQALQERYKEWPEHQQATAREKLNSIINTSTTVLQNPQVVRTRGRPPGSSNRRTDNSTRRDPSGFELMEYR